MGYVIAGFLFALGAVLLLLTLPVVAALGGAALRGLAWLLLWGLILGIPVGLIWLLARAFA